MLTIKIAESPHHAPNYARDHIDIRTATLDCAVIVKRGTVNGLPTVDLQFRDAEGNEFVAMVTGAILEQLAVAIQAARQ